MTTTTHPTVPTAGSVHARDLRARYGDRTVVAGADLVVAPGDRVGLVGENGAGKSTLLRLLAGVQHPDGGDVRWSGTRGLLPQQVDTGGGRTVGALLAAATAEVDALAADMHACAGVLAATPDDAAALRGYGEALEGMTQRDGWSAGARLARALAALDVADLGRGRRLDALSGGQRTRLALASLLVRRPDVLLLDEPTTHLDDAGAAFLEAELRGWPGCVVAASHDRAFLDAVCTDVVDLDPARAGGLTRYGGTYSDYVEARTDERRRWARAHEEWRDEVDRLDALARSGGQRVGHSGRAPRDGDKVAAHFFAQRQDAAVSRRVRDAEQRLRRLRERPVPAQPEPMRFRPPAGRAGVGAADAARVLLQVRGAHVPGRVTVPALDVHPGTRLLVTGPNGHGKSSLLALLAGDLAPARGTVLRARGLRVGLLAQDVRWDDPGERAVDSFAAGRDGGLDDHVRDLLGLGLLPPHRLTTPVGRLSVGEQRRLALAQLLTTGPDLLLLDEPTDHLSPSLVTELEAALAAWPGPVVVVSHDRWLRRRWDGERAAVRDGALHRGAGDGEGMT